MDPFTTLRIINDATASAFDRVEALENLGMWVRMGGHHPIAKITEEAMQIFQDLGRKTLAQAVQAALGCDYSELYEADIAIFFS